MGRRNKDQIEIKIPESLRLAKTKVVKVDLPGIHQFNKQLFHNFYLLKIDFKRGIVQFLSWYMLPQM